MNPASGPATLTASAVDESASIFVPRSVGASMTTLPFWFGMSSAAAIVVREVDVTAECLISIEPVSADDLDGLDVLEALGGLGQDLGRVGGASGGSGAAGASQARGWRRSMRSRAAGRRVTILPVDGMRSA